LGSELVKAALQGLHRLWGDGGGGKIVPAFKARFDILESGVRAGRRGRTGFGNAASKERVRLGAERRACGLALLRDS
jgi:hypothetical protein